MVYRLLGCGVVVGAYHKIQDTDASAKLHIIIELVHRLTDFLKWVEYEFKDNFDSPLDPPLVNKDN